MGGTGPCKEKLISSFSKQRRWNVSTYQGEARLTRSYLRNHMCCVYQEHTPLGRGTTKQGRGGVNMSISNLFSILGWPEEACRIGRVSLWCSVLPSHHCTAATTLAPLLSPVCLCLPLPDNALCSQMSSSPHHNCLIKLLLCIHVAPQ